MGGSFIESAHRNLQEKIQASLKSKKDHVLPDPHGSAEQMSLTELGRHRLPTTGNRTEIDGFDQSTIEGFAQSIFMEQEKGERMVKHMTDLVKAYEILWRFMISKVPRHPLNVGGAQQPVLNGVSGQMNALPLTPGLMYGNMNSPTTIGQDTAHFVLPQHPDASMNYYFPFPNLQQQFVLTPFGSGILMGSIFVLFIALCMNGMPNRGGR